MKKSNKLFAILTVSLILCMVLTACRSNENGIPPGTQNNQGASDTPAAPATVIISDVDVSSELNIKKIDEVHFAQGESFIESFADEDMRSSDFRSFNFEYIPENKEIYVSSWFTDAAVYSLFIDSTEVYEYTDEGYRIVQIGEAPQMIDGEVYIPVEAFAELVDLEIEIR